MNRVSAVNTVYTYEEGNAEQITTHHVLMYEDRKLVENRPLPGKSIHYANDVAENWENGIIK
jgi:hypothetical protein